MLGPISKAPKRISTRRRAIFSHRSWSALGHGSLLTRVTWLCKTF